jgi:hypothetical protein
MYGLPLNDVGSEGLGQFTIRVQYEALKKRMSHHNLIFLSVPGRADVLGR